MRSPSARGLFFAAAVCSSACQRDRERTLYLVVGPEAADRVEFRPRSSYAEYVEFPELRRELRITLASYAASCSAFVPPRGNDASVTVTVTVPAASEIAPGTFYFSPREPTDADADAGAERSDGPRALPSALIGPRAIQFQPGGELELRAFQPEVGGHVNGVLNFEFPGDATHMASSLKGGFEATFCRVKKG